jgi:hypothetical protein
VDRFHRHKQAPNAASVLIMASIIQTVFLVAGPLAGIWLGSRLTRAKDDRQWRRDRCLEAYADVLRGCPILISEAHRLYLALANDNPEAQTQLLHAKSIELNHAIIKAILLSSDEMNITCKALSDCLGRIASRANASPKWPEDEWNRLATIEAAAIVGQFTAEAQNDLRGGDPLSAAERWKHMLRIFK